LGEKSRLHLLPLWGLVLILLLAFALRVYRLDGQSLWSDEGASAFMTGRTAGQIIEAAAGDIHPPLYYLLLRGWSAPMGNSEFALRFLSVCFGILMVALVFKLGERLLGTGVGLVASFITAVSPFHIYYSQEARMYMQMAMLVTLSVYLFCRPDVIGAGQTEPRKKHLVLFGLYILVTAAALYTQYFSFTIVLFQNLVFFVLFWQVWQRRTLWLRWMAGQATIALLYLPWLVKVGGQIAGWPAISQPFGIIDLAKRIFGVFSFGLFWETTTPAKAELVFLLSLAASATWLLVDRRKRDITDRLWESPKCKRWFDILFLLLYLLVPALTMYILSFRRPVYDPKLLLLATPGYFLLLGTGLVSLYRMIRKLSELFKGRAIPVLVSITQIAVVILFLSGIGYASSAPLLAYFHDPEYGRDDYRGLARYIGLLSKPEDAILLNAPGQTEIFGYYYKGDLTLYPLPEQRPIDEAVTKTDLEGIAAQHRRVWVILWGEGQVDPQRFIETWLNQHAYRTISKWFGNVKLILYSLSTAAVGANLEGEPKANFGDQIQLSAYRLEIDQREEIDGPSLPSVNPGDVLPLTLLWQARGQVEKPYTIFVHIIDQHNHLWGQHDSDPVGGAKPTTQWLPQEVVADRHGIPILLGTPPGQYDIEVGLYDSNTGLRLPLLDDKGTSIGDRLLIGPIYVSKPELAPPLEDLFVQNPAKVDFASLRLIGYDLVKLGTDAPTTQFQKGDFVHLTLYWQALEKPTSDYLVNLKLIDEKDGSVILTKQKAPIEGDYPTSQWDRGEIIRDQHRFPLDLAPGKYKLYLGVSENERLIPPRGANLVISDGLVKLVDIDIR